MHSHTHNHSRQQPHRISPQPDPHPTYPYVQSPSSTHDQFLPVPFHPHQPISTPYSLDASAPAWQRPRASSSYALDAPTLAFPEPQLHRATSNKAVPRPRSPPSQYSRNELRPSLHGPPAPPRPTSAPHFKTHSTERVGDMSQPDFSVLSHDLEARLALFQAGKIPESEQEWDRFIPSQALQALEKHEIERQSVLFEIFKSELDYINDLKVIEDVYVSPILSAPYEIMTAEMGKAFVSEVFGNLSKILDHHQRMLASLFSRQRDQHPLVQSVADIILDYALQFTPDYESYIKRSPLSSERYRKELDRNLRFKEFIDECSADPRLRKRDFKTLISRPVTRLPRLKLLLERVQKLTPQDHPDLETIPIVLTVLQGFIKSSEPGIAAAEAKVKFGELYESLVDPGGEINTLAVVDDSQALVHSGPLARQKHDSWHLWSDVFGALLDSHFLLLKEETKPSGTVTRTVIARPIPLEYLRLESFNEPPEIRRERADSSSFINMSSIKQNVYPFTIYHVGAIATRRYTLYAQSAPARDKWHKALVDAIGLRQARQDANKWYVPQALNDGFFRMPSRVSHAAHGGHFTGRALCAAVIPYQDRNYLAVGCTNGIYIGLRVKSSFRRVLEFINPTSMVALPKFNKFIVHCETALFSYPLDLAIRISQGKASLQDLVDSAERLAQKDGNVLFFKAGHAGGRTLVVYAAKSFLHLTLHTLELIHQDKNSTENASSYRLFGSPTPIPRDAHDAAFLPQSVVICASKTIHILRPINMTVSWPTVVPNFFDETGSGNASLHLLKEKCDDAKILGFVRCENGEILIVYDGLGCYVDKYGKPARSAGFISWESKATAFAHRGPHILLFSPGFIEVRNITSGELVQVIEATDVRLLHTGLTEQDMLVVAMTGTIEDGEGLSEKITELTQTTAIDTRAQMVRVEQMWDEWDV